MGHTFKVTSRCFWIYIKGHLDSLKRQSGFTFLFEKLALDRAGALRGGEHKQRGPPAPPPAPGKALPAAAGPGATGLGVPGLRASVGRYTSSTWLR